MFQRSRTTRVHLSTKGLGSDTTPVLSRWVLTPVVRGEDDTVRVTRVDRDQCFVGGRGTFIKGNRKRTSGEGTRVCVQTRRPDPHHYHNAVFSKILIHSDPL